MKSSTEISTDINGNIKILERYFKLINKFDEIIKQIELEKGDLER